MNGIHTEIIEDSHAYTRSDSPWILSDSVSVYGRLIHYISGGGMRAFGRTVRQEEIRRRRLRFGAIALVFAALWLAFWIF